MSEEKTNPENPEITDEQIQEYRTKMQKFYEDQLPLLRAHKEYETLLADIEEAKAKRITMTYRIAQMMSPPPEHESEGEPKAESKAEATEEKKVRNLKKEDA